MYLGVKSVSKSKMTHRFTCMYVFTLFYIMTIIHLADYQIWYSAFLNFFFFFFVLSESDETRIALTRVHTSTKTQQSSYVFTPKYQLPKHI